MTLEGPRSYSLRSHNELLESNEVSSIFQNLVVQVVRAMRLSFVILIFGDISSLLLVGESTRIHENSSRQIGIKEFKYPSLSSNRRLLIENKMSWTWLQKEIRGSGTSDDSLGRPERK